MKTSEKCYLLQNNAFTVLIKFSRHVYRSGLYDPRHYLQRKHVYFVSEICIKSYKSLYVVINIIWLLYEYIKNQKIYKTFWSTIWAIEFYLLFLHNCLVCFVRYIGFVVITWRTKFSLFSSYISDYCCWNLIRLFLLWTLTTMLPASFPCGR